MKYIQCPYCSKKYAVNDMVSAAAGKSIRCKDCKQVFEIIILDSADQIQSSSEQEENIVHSNEHNISTNNITVTPEDVHHAAATVPQDGKIAANQPASSNTVNNSKSMGKRLNYQFIILITLLSLLGIAAITIMIAYAYPELFSSFIEQPKLAETKNPRSHLASIEADYIRKTAASADSNKKQPSNQPGKTPQPARSLLEGPKNPDQDCKDAASRQWISDRVLTAGKIPPEMYAKLLEQSLTLTADVRKLCKDKFLVGRITEAAKINARPEWIKKEIEADLIIR